MGKKRGKSGIGKWAVAVVLGLVLEIMMTVPALAAEVSTENGRSGNAGATASVIDTDLDTDTATKPDSSYKMVRIGYYASEGFQEGDGEDTPRSGYGYEYLQKVASYTGWKYEYVSGSWSELYQQLAEGEIDLMAGIAYDKSRESQLLYPDYEMLRETFYIYKDSDDTSMKSGDYASYAGKRIGVVADTKMTGYLDSWLKENSVEAKKVVFESLSDCAVAFNAHEIDGFVSADNIVSSYSGISPVEQIGKLPYYICISSSRTDLLDELNSALSLVNGQDAVFLADLRNKYTADTSISIFLTKQERNWLNSHTTITVGYLDHYMPYCGTSADGTAEGLIVDIMEDLFAVLPGSPEVEKVYVAYEDQEDLLKALQTGEADVIFPVSGDFSYAEQGNYQQSSGVIQAAVDLLYTGNYSDESIQKIAVNQNNKLQEEYTKANFPEAELVYCEGLDGCIRAVKNGEAGSTLIEALRAVEYSSNDSRLEIVPMRATSTFCLGVSYGNSDFLRVLNHGLSMLGEEYSLTHAYKYMGDVVSGSIQHSIRTFMWIAGGLMLIVLVYVFIVRYRALRRLNAAEREHSSRMQEALLQVHQANYARRAFLHSMSHDIRTPINVILGAIARDEKTTDPAVTAEGRAKIRAAADQLLTMTDNMLEISRMESGEMIDRKEPVNLTALIRLCEISAKRRAEAAGVAFTCEHGNLLLGVHDPSAGEIMILGNALGLQEILRHVLENAFKYNKPQGKVLWKDQLTLQKAGWLEYQCIIQDTGVGIRAEYLEHIFEPFSQERETARTSYMGSGLGLAIVKSMLDTMDGSIDIQSKEGIGTTVTIRIRMEQVTGDADRRQQEDVLGTLDDGTCGATNSQKDLHSADLEGCRVLLVEDNDLNIEVAKFLLEDARAQVTVARNGKEALDAYQNAPCRTYDVILMDLMMPVMNGYESAAAIRSSGQGDAQSIPIIAVTACMAEEVKKDEAAGYFQAFLQKPLEQESLVKTIVDHL